MKITQINSQNQSYKKQNFGNFRPIHARDLDWLKETLLKNEPKAIDELEQTIASATKIQTGKTLDTKFFLGSIGIFLDEIIPCIEFIDKEGNVIQGMQLRLNKNPYNGMRDKLKAIITMISDASQKVLELSK